MNDILETILLRNLVIIDCSHPDKLIPQYHVLESGTLSAEDNYVKCLVIGAYFAIPEYRTSVCVLFTNCANTYATTVL